MKLDRAIFQRTELLMGEEKMEDIAQKKVIIFGIGGVGSWCAESLIRTGIKKLTIVDSDCICVTNINRQVQATTDTIGKVKIDVLKDRLLAIDPYAEINAIQDIYSPDNYECFQLNSYDFIIDAIDSLSNKIHLIRTATKTNATFFSAMGASLKVDPTRIKISEFWQVKGCPLAAKIRKTLRKGELPSKKFLCVHSDELLPNRGAGSPCGTEKCLCPKSTSGPGNEDLLNHEWCSQKAVINGTTAHITAIYGFMLAGLVIKSIYYDENPS